jgi:hypothetical protein
MFYESLAFNEGGNDGFWRFQLRDKYGRWIKMGGSAMFEFRKPNDKNVYKAKGTFQGNIRRGASIIRVGEGEQLPPGDYEVDSRYIESIKAIINTTSAKPEIVDAPKSVNPDVEKQATEREMVAATVKDLEAGDIVQQSTEEALYGQINSVEHGDTESKINVTWSDGSNYDMTLPGEQKIKVWGVEPEGETIDAPKEDEDAEEKLREALEGFEDYVPRDQPSSEIEEIQDTTPGGVTHTFDGKEFYFSPEELEKARYYISKNYLGARDVTDEEGKAFNEEMRALTDYLRPGSTTDETLPAQRENIGAAIPVGELRHSAPPGRFEEIMQNGIRPKITDKVGSEKYSRRRFGVFLANDYTSTEAGRLAEVFRVKVPEDELRVDSGYTPFGDNLYVERTIKPEEIEHLGHIPAGVPDTAIEVKNAGLHDGRGPECTICNPELAPTEPETVDAGNVEEAPEVPEATRVIDNFMAAAEVTAALAEKVGVLPTSIQAPREFKKHAARVILDKMLAAGTTVAQLIGATKSDGPLAVKFSGAPEESLDFESVVNKLPETADIVGQIRVDPDDILNPPYGDDTVMGAGSRLNIMKFNDSGNLEVSTIDVPNGFEMEGKTLKEIQTLAKEDPALRGFYGDFTLVGTSDSQRMFAESLSSRLVQNWAFTSNDSNLESLAIQDAAEELFGLGETASWSMDEGLEGAVALDLKNHGDVYKAFLQAQYDATQEFFAEQGIKEFKLYRGFTSKFKVDTGYADTILRPLSAFSTKKTQAEEFALPGGFDYGYLVEMTVPVKDILGIPGLGFGCYEETEVVVLGGKKSAFIEML